MDNLIKCGNCGHEFVYTGQFKCQCKSQISNWTLAKYLDPWNAPRQKTELEDNVAEFPKQAVIAA